MTKGFFTSEFVKSILLYSLAGYIVWSGHTVDDVKNVFDGLSGDLATAIAVIGVLVDNIVYSGRRTDLKKHAISEKAKMIIKRGSMSR